MFCDWLHRFLISKETQMWCACDIETFRKYIFDLHPQFLAHRFMRSWNLLIEKRYGSFFVHLLFVLSPWKHFRATPETWGSHFVFGGPCVYCIQWHHFFFSFFLPKEGSEHSSQCQAPQNPGLALPGVQVNKTGWALSLTPHRLREQCWTSRHWRRPGSAGLCSTPSERLVSRKGQAGTVKEQETSSAGEDVGKGNPWALLVGMWIVRPPWGTLCRFLKTKNRTSSTFTLGL